MKSFLISIAFLSFFIFLTALNCIYVTDVLKDTADMLDELPYIKDDTIPAQISEKAKELSLFWDRHFSFLALSINTAELRDCSVALGNLAHFSGSDTSADYNSALSEARCRIRVLYRRERFSVENIF